MKSTKLYSIVCLIFVAMVISQICQAEVWDITRGIPFIFEEDYARESVLSQIDETHYLCVYRSQEGWNWPGEAVVLVVETETETITKETTFEYESENAVKPALAKIDDTHYLCVYEGPNSDIWSVVLTVDNNTWTITNETPLAFGDYMIYKPELSKIDDTHYLCAYADYQLDAGWAVVLTVNTEDWIINMETPFEYEETDTAHAPDLSQIDNTHYLCAYMGQDLDGWSVVLTVDPDNWTITKEIPFEFDTDYGRNPALCQIDETHYLCAYESTLAIDDIGEAVILIVDLNSWDISMGTPFVFDSRDDVGEIALAQIDDSHYLCAYYVGETGFTGWSVVLSLNINTGTITAETPFEFDTDYGCEAALAQIDDSCYLCTYKGLNETGTDDKTGWSVILNVELPPVGIDDNTIISRVADLGNNYPNPFNPKTSIKFAIASESQVQIEIYNLAGQKVKTLVNERMNPGSYCYVWNGMDDSDKSVTSGVYFYKMKAGSYTSTRKMILMK